MTVQPRFPIVVECLCFCVGRCVQNPEIACQFRCWYAGDMSIRIAHDAQSIRRLMSEKFTESGRVVSEQARAGQRVGTGSAPE